LPIITQKSSRASPKRGSERGSRRTRHERKGLGVSDVPRDLEYTAEHEWVRKDGNRVVVGITDYAQDQLGDVVFVSLPDVGGDVAAGEPMGEVESTKSVSDVYSPVTGKVVERNDSLSDRPELLNEDPYGEGWLVAVEPAADASTSELLDADGYTKLVEES
jgi:glycine cleavage system H protein